MKFTHQIQISSIALCCVMITSTQAQAKTQEQKPVNSINLTDQNNANENPLYSQQVMYKEVSLVQGQECEHDPFMDISAPAKVDMPNPLASFKTVCATHNKETALEPTDMPTQEADVRLSGYGRFGLDYNDVQLDNSDEEEKETSRLRLTFSSGISRIKPSRAGYGVAIMPGKEIFATKTNDQLEGYSINGYAKWKNNDIITDGVYLFGVEYSYADGISEGKIASGSDDAGIVYQDFAPSGSTGINLGSSGLDVSTSSTTSRLRIQFDMSTETDSGVTFGARLRNKAAFGFGARITDTEHTASVTTPSFNDISSLSVQKLDENYFYFNGYSTISFEPDGKKQGGVGLYLTPRVEAGYRDAKLDSQQINICGLCGSADQNFTINIKDKDDGFYYDLSLNADLAYYYSNNITVGLSGRLGWRNRTAEIINPETGDDLFIRNDPTHLDTDSEYRSGISAWFSAEF